MDVYVERRDFLVMDHVWLNGRHVKIFETNLGNGKSVPSTRRQEAS